jgi:hypothetical protein
MFVQVFLEAATKMYAAMMSRPLILIKGYLLGCGLQLSFRELAKEDSFVKRPLFATPIT